MTRKDALREAIHIVSAARIGKQRREDILAGLALCLQELPFTHWTEAAVFDACDAWVGEHGRLRLRDFASPQLPSHSAIRNRFGMTAREFRDKYYPLAPGPAGGRWRARDAAEWNRLFQADFRRMGCTGQADYNRRRNRELPTWNTLAKLNGLRTWRELLAKLDLETCRKPRPQTRVRVLEPDR